MHRVSDAESSRSRSQFGACRRPLEMPPADWHMRVTDRPSPAD